MDKPLWMKIIIWSLVILIAAAIVLLGVIIFSKKKPNNDGGQQVDNTGAQPAPEEINNNIKIYSGTERPVAVMIDNNTKAWPQSSIKDAYIVYEILVEAGETRLMALFKNTDADVVGPIRSSRHYFLDYALENDAIYTHLGWSPQAQSDIKSLGVNNINGQYYDSGKARTDKSSFWRLSTKKAPHNACASLDKLYEIAQDKGYKITSTASSVLNYVTKDVELSSGKSANTVTIPFSSSNTVKFTYNAERKTYTKYAKGTKQTDLTDGSDITCKNLIITFAENYKLDDPENKGRQGLKNIGTLDGYYITNGKAIPIKCIKNSRKEKTIYQDLNGKTIEVNDGNTFIEICPLKANVVIE